MVAQQQQPRPAAPDRLIKIADVAARYSISTRTVWRYIRAGLIPAPVNKIGGVTRWRESDIDNHLRNQVARAL